MHTLQIYPEPEECLCILNVITGKGLIMFFNYFKYFSGITQNNCMKGNFQEKRISADSDYGQQSSGTITFHLFFMNDSYNLVKLMKKLIMNITHL